MVRYLVLRKKPPPANFEPASWFRPRRGNIKQVMRNKPAPAKRSAQKPWIRKILEEQARRKSSEVVKPLEKGVSNQPSKPLPSDERNNNTRASRDGPTTHLLCKIAKQVPMKPALAGELFILKMSMCCPGKTNNWSCF